MLGPAHLICMSQVARTPPTDLDRPLQNTQRKQSFQRRKGYENLTS